MTNIPIFVRLRGPEKKKRSVVTVINNKMLSLKTRCSNLKSYTFNKVFDTDVTQDAIFDDVMVPVIDDVIDGFNCTVFTYGQAGTGKTFTIQGQHCSPEQIQGSDAGFVARSLVRIFDILDSFNEDYAVQVSYLGILNEDLIDLLASKTEEEDSKLIIKDGSCSKDGNINVQGLRSLVVTNKENAFEILNVGCAKQRSLSSNNPLTSKCHSIFTISIHRKKMAINGEEPIFYGKLNLVDLASSENGTGDCKSSLDSLRDVQKKNHSLLSFNRVILSLYENASHIPFRDSKLTRILQDSLSGSTKTSIVATASTDVKDIEETISTLDLMSKAKSIINKPQPNQPQSQKTLMEYAEKIRKLQLDLEACRSNEGFYVDAAGYYELVNENTQLIEDRKSLIEKLNELVLEWEKEREMCELSNITVATTMNNDYIELYNKYDRLRNIIEHNNRIMSSFRDSCSKDIMSALQSSNTATTAALKFVKELDDPSKPYSRPYLFNLVQNSVDSIVKTSEHEMKNLKLSVLKDKEDMCKMFEARINDLKETLKSEAIEKCTSLADLAKAIITSTAEKFDNAMSFWEETILVYEQENSSLRGNLNELAEMVSSLKSQIATDHSTRQSQYNTMNQQFDDIIKDNCLEKALIEANKLIADYKSDFIAYKKFEKKVREEIEKHINREKNLLKGLKDSEEKRKADKLYFQNALQEIQAKEKSLQKKTQIYYETNKKEDAKIQEKLINFEIQLKSVQAELEKNIDHLGNTMESIFNPLKELCSFIDERKVELSGVGGNLSEEFTNKISLIKTQKEMFESRIAVLQKLVTELVTGEIKTYVQTGETPKRQNYILPRLSEDS